MILFTAPLLYCGGQSPDSSVPRTMPFILLMVVTADENLHAYVLEDASTDVVTLLHAIAGDGNMGVKLMANFPPELTDIIFPS